MLLLCWLECNYFICYDISNESSYSAFIECLGASFSIILNSSNIPYITMINRAICKLKQVKRNKLHDIYFFMFEY